MPPPTLRLNTVLVTDDGPRYLVERKLGAGGFGTTYFGHRVTKSGRLMELAKVCIKVCTSRKDWHGEAFFGELLADDPRVVRLRDALVRTTGTGTSQRRKYILIFDFMEDGTIADAIKRDELRWTEARTRREIKALLGLLARLHDAGVTHRDLKPDNVYLRDGKLVVGDFGITQLDLDPRHHSAAYALSPKFAPKEALATWRWGQADDVYQVGLLAATLVSGRIWGTETVSVPAISRLPVSDEFKSWIWHATGAKAKRYWDAGDATEALDALRTTSIAPVRAPRSLAGQVVVFTGGIAGMSRNEATELARSAGAVVQSTVGDSTTLVVVGKIIRGAGANEGLKLFATRERLRRGQGIRVIGDAQFKRAVRTQARQPVPAP